MNQHAPIVTKDHAWTGSRYVNILDPQPADLILEEIATGLSREQRFGCAATSIFWSVAQHSILAVYIAQDEGVTDQPTLRALLMHDAPEYILRDLIRPVKVNVPSYAPLEDAWWKAIATRFDLPRELPSPVRHYDELTLAVEKRCLISADCGEWPGLPHHRDLSIPPFLLQADMRDARAEFLYLAKRLGVE